MTGVAYTMLPRSACALASRSVTMMGGEFAGAVAPNVYEDCGRVVTERGGERWIRRRLGRPCVTPAPRGTPDRFARAAPCAGKMTT
jgi:hypothetical protein